MRIDNNYSHRQPNFGRLKSITYQKHFNPDFYPEEMTKLLKTIKASKAFNDFFKQYDVDIYFAKGKDLFGKNYVDMMMETTVQKTEGNNCKPILLFDVQERDNEVICPTPELINRLTKKIKNIEFSNLKYKLDNSLKQVEEKEKMEKQKMKLDSIVNSLLTQGAQESPKKKTFFEKLFGWLK